MFGQAKLNVTFIPEAWLGVHIGLDGGVIASGNIQASLTLRIPIGVSLRLQVTSGAGMGVPAMLPLPTSSCPSAWISFCTRTPKGSLSPR